MEELREIAISYFNEGPSEVQAKAKSFFNSMDVDGDGLVNLEEFLAFMRHHGYTHMRNNSFFRLLDRRRDGTLSFDDVMTLYYIIKSGRPFCDCCGEFISAVFFSCVACYNASPRASFTICHPCHRARTSRHAHAGRRAFFLDNLTFMQAITTTPNGTITTTIGSAHLQPIPSSVSASTSTQFSATSSIPDKTVITTPIGSAKLRSSPTVSASTSTQDFATSFMHNKLNKVLVESGHPPIPTTSTAVVSQSIAQPSTISSIHHSNSDAHSTAIVPTYPRQNEMNWTKVTELAFKALEGVFVIANLCTTLATACTIM